MSAAVRDVAKVRFSETKSIRTRKRHYTPPTRPRPAPITWLIVDKRVMEAAIATCLSTQKIKIIDETTVMCVNRPPHE